MPLYLNLANLIVQKQKIEEKYPRGETTFLKDSRWGCVEFDSQDDELLLFAAMNSDEFDFDFFEKAGFIENQDYFVMTRYASQENLPYWVNQNSLFVWHTDCPQNQIKLVEENSMGSMEAFFEKKLYLPINSKSTENSNQNQ